MWGLQQKHWMIEYLVVIWGLHCFESHRKVRFKLPTCKGELPRLTCAWRTGCSATASCPVKGGTLAHAFRYLSGQLLQWIRSLAAHAHCNWHIDTMFANYNTTLLRIYEYMHICACSYAVGGSAHQICSWDNGQKTVMTLAIWILKTLSDMQSYDNSPLMVKNA